MNRPTHHVTHPLLNSLTALFAVAVASALTLVAARPLPIAAPALAGMHIRPASSVPARPHAALPGSETASIALPSPATGEATAEASAQRAPRKTIRRSRQTLAMPYFSFAARS